MPPRVSAVIPIYNPGRLLEVCLDSILRQDYSDLEVVPVDDAGPERVRPLLEAYAKKDPRVKPVFHETNRGLAGALNSGIHASSGEYVLTVEQDCELADSSAISNSVALLLKGPSLVITGSRRLPFAEMSTTEIAFTLLRGHLPDAGEAEVSPVSFSELKCDMFPRVALERVGGFDESFRFSGEDQMIGFRLGEAGFKIQQARPLAYTLRAGDVSGVGANLAREFTYGRTQAGLVLKTSFGSVRSAAQTSQSGRRLSNRALSVASGAVLFLSLPAALLIGLSPWLLLFAVPALARAAVVAARVRSLPRSVARRARAAGLAAFLSPVDDVVYTTAFGAGALRYLLRRSP